MRHIALLTLALAVIGAASASAQVRQKADPDRREARLQQEIGPVLRQRGQSGPSPEASGSQGPGQSAETTRQELQTLLGQLPPSVRAVLQYDPSLAGAPDYLAPYPSLAAFLNNHPEVARNPAYFFGRPGDANRSPEPLEMFAGILAGTGLFLAFMTLLVIVGSVARQVVDYRRWLRQTRMQMDVHTKILDRLQSNEDLLSYIQTPAGRHFLEFTPASRVPDTALASAPLGRILWSVQAGVVLAALGIGLRYAQGTVPEEIIPAFTVLGIIVMSLGLGAVLSAVVAFVLSARLGLLPSRRQETNA
jgi:hypothetical protein